MTRILHPRHGKSAIGLNSKTSSERANMKVDVIICYTKSSYTDLGAIKCNIYIQIKCSKKR